MAERQNGFFIRSKITITAASNGGVPGALQLARDQEHALPAIRRVGLPLAVHAGEYDGLHVHPLPVLRELQGTTHSGVCGDRLPSERGDVC